MTQHEIRAVDLLDRTDIRGWGGYAALFDFCPDRKSHGCIPLVNLHLDTPRHALESLLGRAWSEARFFLNSRRLESTLASMLTDSSASIIAGDFNMTQQSIAYQADWRRWKNAWHDAGCGAGGTRQIGWLSARIDHVLVGNDYEVLRSRVHMGYESDHRPVSTGISWTGPHH